MNEKTLLHNTLDLDMTITDEILAHIAHLIEFLIGIIQDMIPVVVLDHVRFPDMNQLNNTMLIDFQKQSYNIPTEISINFEIHLNHPTEMAKALHPRVGLILSIHIPLKDTMKMIILHN